MRELIANILIVSSVVFVALGVVGIYRFNTFYARALVASKVDTVGYLTLIFGVLLKHGLTFFSLKVAFILLITLIVNPLVTHSIVRSAYISGLKIGKR